MADNLTIATEEGDVEVATKDAGGVHHQKVLLEHDVGGTPTPASTSAPIPVADSALAGFVDGLEAAIATLNGLVDGLEGGIGTSGDAAATQGAAGSVSAKLRTVTSQLNTIVGHVDGLEGFTDGIETSLTTMIGHLDGVETALSTLDGRVDGLEGQLTTLAGYLDGLEALLGSGKTLQYTEIDRATSGQVVAAAGASTKIYVVSYGLVCSTANTVEWRSDTTGISGAMSFAANGGISERGTLAEPLMRTADNVALNLQLGSAQQVSGRLTYYTGP